MKYKYKSIIIVDSDDNSKLITEQYIKELFYTHQCYNTSLIFTLEKPQNIDTNNISHIIILKEDNREKRINIYNMFIPIFKTFETFNELMNKLSYRHSLMIHNGSYYIYLSYMQYATSLF